GIEDRDLSERPVTWRRRCRWVVLSFVPSSLMLGLTGFLSTDIAAVPLLWIVPLTLYLVTFVLAFGSRAATLRAIADRRLPFLIVAVAVLMIMHVAGPLWVVIPLPLLVFLTAALLCHSLLAADRPSPAGLTEFYLLIAFGGMLAGVFNTVAAPIVFNSVVEYPLMLVLVCLFRKGWEPETQSSPRRLATDVSVPACLAILTLAF